MTITMKMYGLFLLFLAMPGTEAAALACPSGKSYEEARAVVRDLQRIVAPGGVEESFATPIGGIKQWINVRGQDRSNPIILFVHGGPVAPLTPSIWEFQRPIEEYFTVVNWDQRGAGKTYLETRPEDIGDSIHIDRYVKDAIEVAEYIRRHYGKEKLILTGHS
jgi:pimeloyl-ACP methyl ester carboxylesterase